MIESKNLLHVFKHNYVTASELTEFLTANPNVEKRIGCLPPDWLKKIKKNDISKATQLVNDVFEKSAFKLSQDKNDNLFCKNIRRSLKKILGRSDISIQYIASGSFKRCHKLTVGDYSYALSTFKQTNNKYRKHGIASEPQYIFTAYKRMSHGRVVKPFMAKVSAYNDYNGGYILSQFIGNENKKKQCSIKNYFSKLFNHQEVQKEKKMTNLTPLEIKLQDFKFKDAEFGMNFSTRTVFNVINGVLIDVGGMEPNNFKLTNAEKKIALNVEKKVIAESNIINNARRNAINIDKISNYLCDLINNGTNIYSADLRNALKDLDSNEQKVATKIIRTQKRLINFIQSLNEDELNSYETAIKSISMPDSITTLTKNILFHSHII